ncbi:type IV secretion system protein VirB1 [Luteibacter sp. 22Crub2.1]|nr:type IV secretion system protein VirB1 [Dyella sp. 333MFSha]SKC05655.1 type IV secretion system protein VirB1 [Luteibacter sp. 22Crub2.1]
MIPGMEMMACPNLAVPAEVMQHVVNVESSRNPYAIGVVGGQLVRQPQNLGEAIATVKSLEDQGYNYSVGAAQVNRANLGKYGLDTFEKAFDFCPNLQAGSRILRECYDSAGKDWGKAFSCYYSGNFVTGYQHGYVQKIFASMARSAGTAVAAAIPLQARPVPVRVVKVGNGMRGVVEDSPSYRVAMRSSVLDSAAAAMIGTATGVAPSSRMVAMQTVPVTNPALVQTPQTAPGAIVTDPDTAAIMSQIGARLPQVNTPSQAGRIQTDPSTAAAMSQIGVSAASPTGAQAVPPAQDAGGIFVPQVHGPNDPPPGAVRQMQQPQGRPVDNADTRTQSGDDAFVF